MLQSTQTLELPYKHISCLLYDRLEEIATLHLKVPIVYAQGEEQCSVSSQIQTLQTQRGVEYLITSDGLKIRLDALLKVGEVDFMAEKNQNCYLE